MWHFDRACHGFISYRILVPRTIVFSIIAGIRISVCVCSEALTFSHKIIPVTLVKENWNFDFWIPGTRKVTALPPWTTSHLVSSQVILPDSCEKEKGITAVPKTKKTLDRSIMGGFVCFLRTAGLTWYQVFSWLACFLLCFCTRYVGTSFACLD